jgi:hypothetical protein
MYRDVARDAQPADFRLGLAELAEQVHGDVGELLGTLLASCFLD